MSATPKPYDCLLHWLPATVLDVRGAAEVLVINTDGFAAVANVIHSSTADGLVAVHETGKVTQVQCTGVVWMASLQALRLGNPLPQGRHAADTGLDRFAQEFANAPSASAIALRPKANEVLDESGFGAGCSIAAPAPAETRRTRISDGYWPGDKLDIADRAERDALLADSLAATPVADASLDPRGNRTLTDALSGQAA